jgi:acyl-CoA thioester hydrolase
VILAGLPIYRTSIADDWIDYNGHLRDAYYGLILSYATDTLMERLGMDVGYRKRTGCTLYTVEMHVHYLREVSKSEVAVVYTRIIGADHKRIHAAFELGCEGRDEVAAAAEVMLLHVQQGEAVRTVPFSREVGGAIDELRRATAGVTATGPGSRRMELNAVTP